MSIGALNWAFAQTDMQITQKFILVVLANYADEENTCYPGQRKIAEQIGASVETVRRSLKLLEDAGFIIRERRNYDGGWRTSDRYRLAVDEPTGQFEGGTGQSEGSPTGQSEGCLPVNLPVPTGQFEGAVNHQLTQRVNRKRERARDRAPHALPEGFTITGPMEIWAKTNAPQIELKSETENFKDWHLAKGSMFRNWDAAWRTWMRRSLEYGKKNATAGAAPKEWF